MDTVICLNVLEHIEDDLGALQNIRLLLAEGGRAVILVPSGQSIYNSLDEELGHFRRVLRTSTARENAGCRL